jgi:hypothetical protein
MCVFDGFRRLCRQADGSGRRCEVLLFIVIFLAFSYIHQNKYDVPTAASRLDLLHSLVRDKSFYIDAYHSNTTDKASYEGHYYSDKAPGVVLSSLPAFAITSLFLEKTGIDLDSKKGWLITSWVSCVFSQALPASMGAVSAFVWLSLFVTKREALITVAAVFLGGMPLIYSTMLFSHAQVVGLISIAMWAVSLFAESKKAASELTKFERNEQTTSMPSKVRMMLAGACCGLSLASEYTSGLVVIALAGYVMLRRFYGLRYFVLGASLFVTAIPVYSWITIQSPLSLPYSYQAVFPQMKQGLYAIKWPDTEVMLKLLFSPSRGLFYLFPFLSLAVLGYVALYRRSNSAFCFLYGVPLMLLIVISGRTWDWKAGICFGPRYLSPILPMLLLPCALAVSRWPKTAVLLAAYTIASTSLVSLTDACPDYDNDNPLVETNIPDLFEGRFSYNLGMVLGLSNLEGAIVYLFFLLISFACLWQIAKGTVGNSPFVD